MKKFFIVVGIFVCISAVIWYKTDSEQKYSEIINATTDCSTKSIGIVGIYENSETTCVKQPINQSSLPKFDTSSNEGNSFRKDMVYTESTLEVPNYFDRYCYSDEQYECGREVFKDQIKSNLSIDESKDTE